MKKVFITGIAGTLGKEFARQLQDTYEVHGCDNSEWAVVEARKELTKVKNITLTDYAPLFWNGDFFIHCAAYKHVDQGEKDPISFISNNISKWNSILPYLRGRILFISTDKAVEPISVYGYTKALGEHLTRYYGGSVARLGNIISSNGSVIPLWENAIENNLPIPVTDLRMTRYMISANDAVKYIWQRFLKRDKLIIPEMGKPMKLKEIITLVLKRHGYKSFNAYKPGIKIIGMRAGEKLEEKLKWPNE